MRFEFDERLLHRADGQRRTELLEAAHEVDVCGIDLTTIQSPDSLPPSDAFVRLTVRSADGVTFVVVRPDDPVPLLTRRLHWRQLDAHIDEYDRVIRRIMHLTTNASDSRFEALDYAKRLIHDEAGEILKEQLAPIFNISLKTGRSLFTLLFLMRTDLPTQFVRTHRAHL